MKIIVDTKNKLDEQEEKTIGIHCGQLGTAPKIVISVEGTDYFIDPWIFTGLL